MVVDGAVDAHDALPQQARVYVKGALAPARRLDHLDGAVREVGRREQGGECMAVWGWAGGSTVGG